jgi:hypothetical protein
MSRMTGHAGAVSFSYRGALATANGHATKPWRVLALLVGAALACLITLAVATLPAPTAPSSHSLASRHGLQSHLATSLPAQHAPTEREANTT